MAYIQERARKDGSLCYTVRIRNRNLRKPITKTFTLKTDAERYARQIEIKLETDSYIDESLAKSTLIKDLCARYVDEISVNKAKTTRIREKSKMRVFSEEFGEMSLAELTSEDIVQWVLGRMKAGLAKSTIIQDMNKLGGLVRAATSIWMIPLKNDPHKQAQHYLRATGALAEKNFAEGKGEVARDRRLAPGELEAMLAVKQTKHSMIKPCIEFAIETCMRRGEICNMRWEHVKGNVLVIPRSKTDGHQTIKGRTIPLSPKARKILKGLHRNLNGNVWDWTRPQGITQAFGRLRDEAGIEDLHFHDLRHEGISRLFERGWGIVEVAKVSGHKKWDTLRIYTQLDASLLAQKMEGFG